MENPSYENENIERKYLKNMWKNQFLKVKNSALKLKKDFVELKDTELKHGKVKIKKEIWKLFSKPIIVSIDDKDKFEKKKKNWRK